MHKHNSNTLEKRLLRKQNPKGPGKRGHIIADTKFVSATNVRVRGNICVGNNVSATMCPRLPGP